MYYSTPIRRKCKYFYEKFFVKIRIFFRKDVLRGKNRKKYAFFWEQGRTMSGFEGRPTAVFQNILWSIRLFSERTWLYTAPAVKQIISQ